MGKASREKSERKIQAQLQPLSHAKPEWYETNLLWVPLTTALGIILFVVAAMMKGDFRFLLWVALALSVHPSWILIKNIGIQRASFQKACFLVLLILGTIGTYEFNDYLKERPIAISPSKVDLANLSDPLNVMRGYIDLEIYNRSDDSHYDVWVKLLISSDILTPEILDIDFPTIDELSLAGKDVLDMSVGSMCLAGNDKNKRPAFLCVVDKLNPKGMFRIKLTTPYSINKSSPERIGQLSAEVLTFSDHPGKHFNHPKGMMTGSAAEHESPEAFTATTMIHFCDSNGETLTLQGVKCTPNSKNKMKS